LKVKPFWFGLAQWAHEMDHLFADRYPFADMVDRSRQGAMITRAFLKADTRLSQMLGDQNDGVMQATA